MTVCQGLTMLATPLTHLGIQASGDCHLVNVPSATPGSLNTMSAIETGLSVVSEHKRYVTSANFHWLKFVRQYHLTARQRVI